MPSGGKGASTDPRESKMSISFAEQILDSMVDESGNCFVWKTTSSLGMDVDNGNYIDFEPAEMGDRIEMRATVKEHSEYRGIKQTVIVRPKVKSITKRA